MKSLDDEYANAAYIPGADKFVARWEAEAGHYRKTLLERGRAEIDMVYGASERQCYDLFRPLKNSKGILVFVHGGYWLNFDKSYWSHLAAGAVQSGWHVAMLSYDLCPAVGISEISRQIASAVVKVAERVPGPMILTGHSAGGHLVARMGVGDLLPTGVLDRIAHIVPISPVADLRPLLHTKMNASFKLDETSAAEESTVLMAKPAAKVTVWVGGDERPAFLDQAGWLSDAWKSALVIEPNRHHFDVIDGLINPQSTLCTRLLDIGHSPSLTRCDGRLWQGRPIKLLAGNSL
jgi:acetyl esterase/lipase